MQDGARFRPHNPCPGARGAPNPALLWAIRSTLRLFTGRVRDLETATRPAGAVAAFGSRGTDHVTDEALHRQAHRGMLTGECRERARSATNHERAISFNLSHRSELLVHESACESDSVFQCPGWPCSST